MFRLHDVSKFYDGKVALRPTSLDIAAAQTTVLIGPSGCGKSTLLRLMVGLLTPSGGEIVFEGQQLNATNILQLRHRMGYVIQDGGLFPHLTARANATLMARHLRWPKKKIGDRLAELTNLTHFPADGLDRYPGQLSGGQRQRVSLMRALFLDPDVLLLDEPLGALDPLIRAELQTELREIFRNVQKTVVMVTHDLAEAVYFADTIVLLRDGVIVQVGTFRELAESPADPFVTQFIQAQRGPQQNAMGPT